MAVSHDSLVDRAVMAVSAADKQRIVDGFVASLSTRRLDLRSALGSYGGLRHLPRHAFEPSKQFRPSICGVCGLGQTTVLRSPSEFASFRTEQNRLVQFHRLPYAVLDLETFPELELPAPPSDEDRSLLRGIVDALRALPETATLGHLQKALVGKFRSNKRQRQYLLEAWGICGILCPPDVPSFFDRWVPYDELECNLPDHFYARDTAYPLQHWRGEHGVDETRLSWWFGAHLP